MTVEGITLGYLLKITENTIYIIKEGTVSLIINSSPDRVNKISKMLSNDILDANVIKVDTAPNEALGVWLEGIDEI